MKNHLTLWESFTELQEWYQKDVEVPLTALRENKGKIKQNEYLYYRQTIDEQDIANYYRFVNNYSGDGHSLFYQYHELVTRTHTSQVPYFLSKDHYLYTWVDLQPDGSVKSIYSGEHKDPQTMLEEDYQTIKKRYIEFQILLNCSKQFGLCLDKKINSIDTELKFNTEHIVPQSWFGGQEPMKGDLHHLFVCQPECNTARSNFPYIDFSFYEPESPKEKIQNRCGVAANGGFEPENGKGTAARAMLYFLLRYPNTIRKSFLKQINLSLLINWHEQFPVTIYEKHRNRAIYRIQGNRNPFIDQPELAAKLVFPLK
ncbi:endonuclease I family protein [Bacillus sp. FJAT-42315]|uniref:endonuclease I family protein n=1 Tax=Bacillus sp. FJAT-42315 TaxID=2014077 RepID=UPI000C244339|nr:endonuclease [Bacillus sp. FJAT-42315]